MSAIIQQRLFEKHCAALVHIIDNANPLIMHLNIIRNRQDIWFQTSMECHAAANIFIFPYITPHPRTASPVCKKGRIENLPAILFCYNTVMDDNAALLFAKNLQYALNFVRFPDVILIC